MYGPNWRIPNPGFAWARDRKSKSPGGRVPPKAGSLVNWMSYLGPPRLRRAVDVLRRRRPTRRSAPDGARSRLRRRAGQSGLRSGRLPGRGTRLELDRVSAATKRTEDLGIEQRPNFSACDFDEVDAVRSAAGAARFDDEPVLFYGRFLLHALFEDTQHTLLRVIAEQSRPGDMLALEFRGQADAERPKLNRLPYRRFLDADAVGDELARARLRGVRQFGRNWYVPAGERGSVPAPAAGDARRASSPTPGGAGPVRRPKSPRWPTSSSRPRTFPTPRSSLTTRVGLVCASPARR